MPEAEKIVLPELDEPTTTTLISKMDLIVKAQDLFGPDEGLKVSGLFDTIIDRLGDRLGPMLIQLILEWLERAIRLQNKAKLDADAVGGPLRPAEAIGIESLLSLLWEKFGPLLIEKLGPILIDRLVPFITKMITDWIEKALSR